MNAQEDPITVFAKGKKKAKHSDEAFTKINRDTLSVIADWHHFVILSLMTTKDYVEDLFWISKRLSLSVLEVKAALLRLERLQLIEKQENQPFFKPTNRRLRTSDGVISSVLRISHRQSLQQAIDAPDEVPIELRDIASSTVATSPSKTKRVKEMIKQFGGELCSFLEEGEKTEVFNVNFQLFPISKIKPKNSEKGHGR